MSDDRQPSIRPNVAFRRLAKVLAADIRAGRYVPGEVMPSRRALAETHDVTPNTVNKAIHELVGQGLLETVERLGTRVVKADRGSSAVAGKQPMAHTGATTGLVAVLATTDYPFDGSPGPLTDIWSSTVARHLELGLAMGGARTTYHRVYYDALPSPRAAIEAALATRPSAIVVINIYGYAEWENALRLAIPADGPATLVLTTEPMLCPFAQLTYDQSQFGYLAGSHLVANGYRRLVLLRTFTNTWLEQRIAGVQRAAQHAGRTISCEVVSLPTLLVADEVQQLAPEVVSAVLAPLVADFIPESDGSTALVLPSDRLALALLPVLRAKGYEPGRDFGIIGFDDVAAGRTAGLSTVRPPLEAMGDRAAKLVLGSLGGALQQIQETLPPMLLPRLSTDRLGARRYAVQGLNRPV